MKLLILLSALALAGCAQVQGKPIDITKDLARLTQDDLATAIEIANAVTPPDIMAIMCVSFLQVSLGSLQGGRGFITPTGVASALETARIGYRAALGGASSTQHDDLIINCGPLALSVANEVAQGALTLSNGGGFAKFLLALIPVVGVLPPL